jgi:hypothetical protein
MGDDARWNESPLFVSVGVGVGVGVTLWNYETIRNETGNQSSQTI